ncbi:MAG: hypothetical protein P8Q37_10555 [Porticoccaceae bacterium]|nr:hypothetical protein [Porticoccaceae bacterium]MDG1475335.1 hypothetical protein [Porticoccaceae bacterium]
MTGLIIWIAALITYGVFWLWYFGFGKKVTEGELNHYMRILSSSDLNPEFLDNYRQFFAKDDGKEFFMVNTLELKEPKVDAMALLERYQRVFIPGLMRRAGHPYFIGSARAKNIERLEGGDSDDWQIAALMRYRSRRDFGEIIVKTFNSEHHELKLSALEKTNAFPVSAQVNIGSVSLLVGLIVAFLACVSHLVVS